MRILLTGTAGQVGGALLPLLRDRGEILAPALEEFDLSKPGALADGLDRLKPDLIINPAAYTAVDRAEDETALAFSINAEAPAAIAGWAARHNVPRFISRPIMFSTGSAKSHGTRIVRQGRSPFTVPANSPAITRSKRPTARTSLFALPGCMPQRAPISSGPSLGWQKSEKNCGLSPIRSERRHRPR
jgi:nucleoside-diphosphate-sugar epimerase